MKVAITQLQLRILRENPETQNDLPHFLREGDPDILEGTTLELQEFRELCADIQVRIGFDGGYKLNSEGKAMEDLVDKLFPS